MNNWKEYELGNICSRLSSGKGIKANMISDTAEYAVYGGNGIRGYTSDYNFEGDCAIIGRQGAYCGNVRYFSGKAYMTEHAVIVCANSEHNTRYLSYVLTAMNLGRLSGQSAQPGLSVKTLSIQKVKMPPLDIQRKIVAVVSSLEQKIELNTAINENLESQAQALYNKFFSPKSNSTGTIKTLDMYCSIFTGKKNANAAIDNGSYKFFTCSPDALKIDSYIYDGNAIIISGNGAYTGRTRFYSGKFDLYQRTYACTILSELNPDYIYPLYWFVKFELSQKIMGGTRGSAIPYIVMNDLAKFEFVFNEDSFNQYMIMFKNITLAIQQNEFENEKLALLRDTLLPKLMNGEIDVSEVKI